MAMHYIFMKALELVTYGLSSQVLSTDGSGNLSWISQTGNASVAVTNVAPSAPSVGDLWWHSEEGQLKVYYTDQGVGTVSSQWVDASQRWGIGGSNTGAGGTGITSINGLDAFVQTFSVGSSGNEFNISSVGSSHTFNIPLAGNGVTGLIDSGTQSIYGAKTFDSDLYAVNNIYVSKDNYIGGVPSDFSVGGSIGSVYFGIAKGQNINRFAGMVVEEVASPLGGGNLNGEIAFYTDSETVDNSTERLRITGFGTVISHGPVSITNSTGSTSASSGALVVTGGVGISASLNVGTDLGVSGLTTLTYTSEKLNTKTSAGSAGTVTHDLSTGSIFYHSSISNNFTANITNVPTTNDRAIGVTFILAQGGTAYMANVLQIDGATQTIKWVNNSTPTGTANKVDIVGFSLIRTGSSWLVLGQYSTYG
jgi:hypothetical protein